MKSPEIRRAYLEFFEKRGHTVHPSDSLVPVNDPSLLFTGAGMNQFKDMFLGCGHLPFRRATTSQKCLRLPDLDNVGRTPSHHTFFEMLGNFSFGDYFKREAIAWADELLRTGFGIDRKQLCISVFEKDDETVALWSRLGYSAERIFRYGEKDNFWPSEAPSKGPNGPCGPCSEIYFDFGAEVAPELGADPRSNGNRFVEIWNLVFTQYDRRDGGMLVPLPQENIDTGMGLERLVRVLARARTNFETDLFRPMIEHLERLTGREYGSAPDIDRPMRRIADHIRAVVFCIADGAVPSNEKQGYVVRKILRRALADGLDLLGIKDPFLADLAPTAIGVEGMTSQFPELARHRDRIVRVIREEELKFLETYRKGRARLQEEMNTLAKDCARTLSGKTAFFLWDTAGFPVDLTRRILEDHCMSLDNDGFEAAMEEQRARSRAGSNLQTEIFASGPLQDLKKQLAPTRFLGYEQNHCLARLVAIFSGNERLQSASEGQDVVLLFEETPFYAEGGGQVGDRGEFLADSFKLRIHDTRKTDGYFLHHGTVVSGSVAENLVGTLQVSLAHRQPTRRNHTATHLLHWALRKVLSASVEQKGSLVDADRLRFDFSHKTALTPAQIQEVEGLVNEEILGNLTVSKTEKSLQEALDGGAVALFGEKYGSKVRVVRIEDSDPFHCSAELCGGTHVERTGDIGGFKIVAESSVAAGVRRVEAVTGHKVIQLLQAREELIRSIAGSLRATPEEIPQKVGALQEELKKLRKEGSRPDSGTGLLDIAALLGSMTERATAVSGLKAYHWVGALDGQQLMAIVDGLQSRKPAPGYVVILVGEETQGAPVIVFADKTAQMAGINAGEICRNLSKSLGGGGGGNPSLARGKGSTATGAKDAVESCILEIGARLRA